MNFIKHGATPLQTTFAALAIFALIAMPMGQVFAEEIAEPVVDPVEQVTPQSDPVPEEDVNNEVDEEDPASVAVTEYDLVKKGGKKGDNDCVSLENRSEGHNENCDDQDDEDCDFDMRTVGYDDDCDNHEGDDENCDRVVTLDRNHNDDCDDNVPIYGSITIEKEVAGDVADWSFGFTGSQGAFTLTDEAPSKVFSDLNAGGYTFDEVDTEGWDLIDVKCTDDAEPSATLQAVVAPSDLVVTLEPGENVTCTFTNTQEKEPVQNSCLVPEGALETFVVGDSPEGEFTLQTILGDTADVEDNQYNYQVWDFASDDTDTVTFEVKILAKHAGNIQEFGYYKAGDTSSFTPLFSIPPEVAGYTKSVTVSASFADSLGFAIRTSNGDASNIWYSEKALNPGSEDHVAAYNPDDNTYVLAFEDLAFNIGDEDYNDLVVQLKVIRCSEVKNPMCELVIVSDDTTMVDQEGDDTLAKLVALPIHENWDAIISGASWIWSESPLTDAVNNTYATFLKDFSWYGGVQSATLEIAADNSYEYNLNAANGMDINENNFASADSYDVQSAIEQGENSLAIDVKNWAQPNGTPESNPAGLMYKLTIKGSDSSCSNEPEVPVCASFVSNDYDVVPGQDFDLSWVFGDDVDFVEIDGIEGSFGPLSATEISISEDTTFMLTAYAEGEGDEELFTCSLDVDTHSSGGGHGGSSKKKGSVLGDSEDREEGGVAGASTEMPAGAPNTGAGGTSPVVVSLPSLLAVLNTRSFVRKSK